MVSTAVDGVAVGIGQLIAVTVDSVEVRRSEEVATAANAILVGLKESVPIATDGVASHVSAGAEGNEEDSQESFVHACFVLIYN